MEKDGPEVIQYVDDIDLPNAFRLEASSGRVGIEIHAKECLAYFTQAARKVCIFAVELYRPIETADTLESRALHYEVAAQDHVAHDAISDWRDAPKRIENPYSIPTSAEVTPRAAQGDNIRSFAERLLYDIHPLGRNVCVGINVGKVLARRILKTALERAGKPLFRLKDDARAMFSGNFGGAICGSVVNDDYLLELPVSMLLGDIYRLPNVGFFIVGTNDECDVHHGMYFSITRVPRFIATNT